MGRLGTALWKGVLGSGRSSVYPAHVFVVKRLHDFALHTPFTFTPITSALYSFGALG